MTVHVIGDPTSGSVPEMNRLGLALAEKTGSPLMVHIDRSQFSRFAAEEIETMLTSTRDSLVDIRDQSISRISDSDLVVFGCWGTYARSLASVPGQTRRFVFHPTHDAGVADRPLARRNIIRVLIHSTDWFGRLSAESGVGRHIDLGLPTNPLLSLRSRSVPTDSVGIITSGDAEVPAYEHGRHLTVDAPPADRLAMARSIRSLEIPAADRVTILHAVAARARVVVSGVNSGDDLCDELDGVATSSPGEPPPMDYRRCDPERAFQSLRSLLSRKLELAADQVVTAIRQPGSSSCETA